MSGAVTPMAGEDAFVRAAIATRADEIGRWRLKVRLTQLALLLLVLLGWDAAPDTLVSSPLRVAQGLYTWAVTPARWSDLGVTLVAALAGYAIGTLAGGLSGLICGLLPRLNSFLAPFIGAANAIPRVALAPVVILVVGLGIGSKIVMAAIVTFFIIFWSTVSGVRSIDRLLLLNARIQGAGPLAVLRHIYLPAMLSWIITSLRLGITWALLTVLYAEYLGSYAGIGNTLSRAQANLDQDAVVTALFVVGLFGFALDRLLAAIETRTRRWQQ